MMLALCVGRLPNLYPRDVYERDTSDHADHMLDGEEARDVDLHRGGEIAEPQPCDGTQEEIQDETNQKLQVDADRQQQPPQFILRRPRPSRSLAADRAEPGDQTCQQYGPAQPGMEP